MIDVLILIILLYANVRVMQYIINIQLSIRFLQTKKMARLGNMGLTILIPVYDEASIIGETVQYFEHLISSLQGIRVIFVTTAREGTSYANKTYRAIKEAISSPKISIYQSRAHGKAAQLNEAINRMKHVNNHYIAIFDADSRPSVDGIRYVMRDPEPALVYQMFSSYCADGQPLLARANALFQTRWTLAYELPTILKNYSAGKICLLAYCVGHGLIIESTYAKKNPFPTYSLTEDLAFGYRLSFANVLIKPVPYFDTCTVPYSLSDNIQQSARWFAGELLLYKEYLASKNGGLWKTLHRYAILSQWILGPPVLFVVGFWAIRQPLLFTLLLLFLFNYVFVIHSLVARFQSRKQTLGTYLSLGLKSVLNCAGPWYAVFRLLLDRLGISIYSFFKTPRAGS